MKAMINDNLFNLKYVITRKDIEKGMMKKKFDDSFNGMLFMMGDGEHSFWMKNCIVHLDIIFIDNEKITEIHHNVKPCFSKKCETYNGVGNMVLELPGGDCKKYKINKGDKITLFY